MLTLCLTCFYPKTNYVFIDRNPKDFLSKWFAMNIDYDVSIIMLVINCQPNICHIYIQYMYIYLYIYISEQALYVHVETKEESMKVIDQYKACRPRLSHVDNMYDVDYKAGYHSLSTRLHHVCLITTYIPMVNIQSLPMPIRKIHRNSKKFSSQYVLSIP